MQPVTIQVTGQDEAGDPAPEEYTLGLPVAQSPFDHTQTLTARVVPDPFGLGTDYLVVSSASGQGEAAHLLLEDVEGDAAPELAVVGVPASLTALSSGPLPGSIVTGPLGQALVVPLPAPAP